MFWLQTSEEPPLHKAVLNECHEELHSLSQNKSLLLQKNSLGFTALELAQLLGKQCCIRILQPEALRIIKVVFKDREIVSKCSVEQFEDAFKLKYLSHQRFANYNQLKDTIHNCPWILKTRRWGEENRELGRFYHKEINAGTVADITIKWIDPQLGYGIFSNHELPAGTFVGEYTGVVRRLNRFKADHNAYCFHYPTRFWSWSYYMIDALREGNEMRFINHSDQSNLEPKCLVEQGLLHLVFITARNINRGEQLTFNYGSDFWRHRKRLEGL